MAAPFTFSSREKINALLSVTSPFALPHGTDLKPPNLLLCSDLINTKQFP